MVVEPVVSKLSTKFWFSTIEKEATQETKHNIEFKIEQTLVPVKAILGRTTLLVSDFIEIQPGDVIALDTNINGDLEVLVGDIHKFNAKPGVKKNKVSAKITEIIRREDE
jgi:flagellar motor switch protein FliM